MVFTRNFYLLLTFLFFTTNSYSQTRIYVDQNATGSANGTSWSNAFTSIDSAFTNSVTGDTIWIANGRYFPSGNGVNARFNLPNGRAIYGSFAGMETSINQRDIANNPTYLDGDIGTQGTASDNCRAVVYANNLTSPVLLDGFKIVNGYAYTVGGSISVGGGGARILNSNVSFTNCTFSDNYTYMRGAAIYSQNTATITLTNCVFSNNSTGNNTQSIGGAIYMNSGNLKIYGCTFTSNQSKSGGAIATYSPTVVIDRTTFSGNKATTDDGGAIYNGSESTLSVYNSLFAGNYSEGNCAAIYTSSTLNTNNQKYINCTFADNYTKKSNGYTAYASDLTNVYNCIFWGNAASKPLFNLPPALEPDVNNCLIEGGISYGSNNINQNPLFVKSGDAQNAPFVADTFDYSLQSNSPGINNGANTYVNSNYNTDIIGNNRTQGNYPDIGAFESPYTTFKITTTSNDPAADETFGGGQYLKDSSITISTVAKSNCYEFLYWKENNTIVSYDTSFTITASADRSFVSYYSQKEFDVHLVVEPSLAGSATGTGNYLCNNDSSRSFTLILNDCYEFVNWTIDGKEVSTSLMYSAILSESIILKANCKRKNVQVQLLASPPAGGTVSGDGTFPCDSFIQIAATANNGYKFNGWKESGTTVSNSANYPFVVKKDVNLVAEFTSTASLANNLKNTISIYPNPATDHLTLQGAEDLDDAAIYSVQGAKVIQISKAQLIDSVNKVSIKELETGYYYLKLMQDTAVAYFAFVKQ